MVAKNARQTKKASKKKKMMHQPHHTTPQSRQAVATRASQPKQTLMPYDENLLERSRTQWQFGDWQSLTKLNRDTLQHHPDRAKLALLAAAGHLQTGKSDNIEAKQFIRLAQDWGIDKKLISRVLIAGVHNNLARAAAIAQQETRAWDHFEKAILVGSPSSATRLLTQARINEQFQQLGLSTIKNTLQIENVEVVAPVKMALSAKQDTRSSTTLKQQKKHNKPASQGFKFSSNANIDDFIADIEPFFYGYSITYVDIGAFIGEIFLKLHQSKKIKIREAHLFEPNPKSYKKLQDNVTSANISKLHTYNHALGKEDGELYLSAAHSMTKVIKNPETKESQTGVFHINCHPLDKLIDLFTDHHIHLLKVDVEGVELEVLEGAQQLLKEQKIDVIYIEVGFNQKGTQQTYFGELDSFFQQFGYRVFKIYEQKNEWIQDSPLLRRCNFAYMSAQFAAANPYKAKQELIRLKKEITQLKASKISNKTE